MRWSSTPLRRASIASILGLVTPEKVRLVCTCANFGMGQWGEKVLRRVAIGMLKKEASPPAPTEDEDWLRQQRAKLAAAEMLAQGLSGEELKAQRRRIAGLKRSITLGPGGSATSRCARVQLAKRPLPKESASARRRKVSARLSLLMKGGC
jgi:hypothetical protein